MTPRRLHLAPNFSLPQEVVAESLGVLAMRGAGKSNTVVVMAEEMWKAKIPWVAIDPKGDWYGLRSSADGKRPGLALPVFGGLHADVPLYPDGGALLADLVVSERLTCVVDVSDFTKSEQTRFLLDFAVRLFREQRRNPEPMHLFLEEAHEYLPQKVMRDQAQLVGAWSKIVKQGRAFGLGSTTVSQRSASLNKDVLTQIGTLIVMRTPSPQDRAAIEAWVKEYDIDREMMSSLPSLRNGEAWVWSPHFLGTFEKVKFRQRETFDSGATPKLGKVREPATLANIDLSAIEASWAEQIEKAKEQDPRELKRRIAELERKLAAPIAPLAPEVVEIESPTWHDGIAEDFLLTRKAAEKLVSQLENTEGRLIEMQSRNTEKLKGLTEKVAGLTPVREAASSSPVRPAAVTRRGASESGDPSLPKMQRKILSVLAQHGSRRTDQLLLQSGYRIGGAWNTAMSRLRDNALIYRNGDGWAITPEGINQLGPVDPLPVGPALRDYWKNELGQMAARIIDVLWENPSGMPVESLLEATGYRVGGAWNTAMSRLRKLNIVTPGKPMLTNDFVDATS